MSKLLPGLTLGPALLVLLLACGCNLKLKEPITPVGHSDAGVVVDSGEEEAIEEIGVLDAGPQPDPGPGPAHQPPGPGGTEPDPPPPLDEPSTECGPTAEGQSCEAEETCDLRGCGAVALGRCLSLPEACSPVYLPVCGCDGFSYRNGCERLRAGVGQAHEGPCDGGDLCSFEAGDGCAEGMTCDMAACGEEAVGTCVPASDSCASSYAPVCGCDGISYLNDCERLRAGVGLDREGACEESACAEGTACPEGSRCDPRGCDPTSSSSCVPSASECAAIVQPVCGCDGVLYANDCQRLGAGVAQDDSLGCFDAVACSQPGDCAENTSCDLLGCGEGASGLCLATPNDCEPVYAPVCGCDQRTYLNDCERLRATVAKVGDGPCR